MQTLNESQHKAAALLADGMSKNNVAVEVGVHVRTIKRWCDLEEFAREVADRRARRNAEERVEEAKRVVSSGFNLEDAIAQLRQNQEETRLEARNSGKELLAKCRDRIQQLSPEDIAVRDLPSLIRAGHELIQWAIESEEQELELDQLIELKLGPDSLVAQKVELEADAAVERMFQAIALSDKIPAEYKQAFYQILGGEG